MNGRAIRKRLMGCRGRSMFGDRAWLAVRVPMGMWPEPPPPDVAPPGKAVEVFDGWWVEDLSGGRERTTAISEVFSGGDPRTRPEGWSGPEPPLFVEQRSWGGTGECWRWWTGWTWTYSSSETDPGILQAAKAAGSPLPEETVAAFRDRRDWVATFVHGDPSGRYAAEFAPRWLDEVVWWAKTVDVGVVGDDVLLTFGVKWRLPWRKLRFCSALHRAIRDAKAEGFRMRVL